MKISGKRINDIASPGWTFVDYRDNKAHIRDKNFKRSFGKAGRRYMKELTKSMIEE